MIGFAQTVADAKASKDFARVVVKYGGTDPATGASRSAREDLGFITIACTGAAVVSGL